MHVLCYTSLVISILSIILSIIAIINVKKQYLFTLLIFVLAFLLVALVSSYFENNFNTKFTLIGSLKVMFEILVGVVLVGIIGFVWVGICSLIFRIFGEKASEIIIAIGFYASIIIFIGAYLFLLTMSLNSSISNLVNTHRLSETRKNKIQLVSEKLPYYSKIEPDEMSDAIRLYGCLYPGIEELSLLEEMMLNKSKKNVKNNEPSLCIKECFTTQATLQSIVKNKAKTIALEVDSSKLTEEEIVEIINDSFDIEYYNIIDNTLYDELSAIIDNTPIDKALEIPISSFRNSIPIKELAYNQFTESNLQDYVNIWWNSDSKKEFLRRKFDEEIYDYLKGFDENSEVSLSENISQYSFRWKNVDFVNDNTEESIQSIIRETIKDMVNIEG